MRKFLLLSLLAVLLGAIPAYAETVDCLVRLELSFSIKNLTGIDISAIHVAQSHLDVPEWSKNLLKPKTPLKKGASVSLSLESSSFAPLWTIKLVDKGGRVTIHKDLPLPSIYYLELQPDGKIKYQQTRDT